MKKILFVVIALGFVVAGNFETFAQKRTVSKKTTKRKLVKCRVNGKIVYRTKCPINTVESQETTPDLPITRMETPTNSTNGNGQGGGLGAGRGSGNGNGSGYGTGSGNGDGNTERLREPPMVRRNDNVTSNVVILSKPRANYTDAARQNQAQGTITLRVQFLANGQIGEISPINTLPYGLTEQAMAAARNIRFEPAKQNGKPYTVVRNVSYSFTLY